MSDRDVVTQYLHQMAKSWPQPPEIGAREWRFMPPEERGQWLFEHAFVRDYRGGGKPEWVTSEKPGYVINPETRDTQTSQQVLHAINTAEFGIALTDATGFSEALEETPQGPGRENILHVGGFVLALVIVVLLAILAVRLFGGDGDSGSVADDPAGEVVEGAGEAEVDDAVPDAVEADPAVPAGDEGDTPGNQGEAVADPPTPEELEAQEPIPLTDGPWRVFVDPSESGARWDVVFLAGGVCSIPGDPSVVSCTYVEDPPAVEITLDRHDAAEAQNADGDVRTGEVDWNEWFHMTRVGNTMYGPWEIESWIFSYDNGLEWRGNAIFRETAFIRPVHAADP